MKEVFEYFIDLIARIHGSLMRINDTNQVQLTDKMLHFYVFGAAGLFLFWVVNFLFQRIGKWSITAISLIYTFTLMCGLSLAIEIGQGITKTGAMEFRDIVYGLWGCVLFTAVFLALRGLFRLFLRMLKRRAVYDREDEM